MSVDLIDQTIAKDMTNSMEDARCQIRLRLPDQSDSSDNDEPSPRKRLRSDHGVIERTDNNIKQNWDHYVRSGSKLKSLVGSILHVARQLHTNERIQNRQQVHRDVDNSNDDDYENAPGIATGSHPRSTSNDNAAKLAYEKTAECLMLEKVRVVEQKLYHQSWYVY
jgi:hypothetical protein